MIYNFNLGIGWASSGVEYAQRYRAGVFRRLALPARFVFTDMFPRDDLIAMTRNLGLLDEEVIWLYTFFTDQVLSPVTYTLDDLRDTIAPDGYIYSRNGATGRIEYYDGSVYYQIYFTDESDEFVHRVEIVSGGRLIRKDYFMAGRVFSEYYAPKGGRAHLYQRRFFNRDGSAAYEEINDDGAVMYKFPDRVICSKQELIGYMVERLALTADDTVIIDRCTGQGQAILENAGPARIGIVVHADHFSESGTDADIILWNNYYEYAFSMHRHIDFYVTSTEAQRRLLIGQFKEYLGAEPRVEAIPAGSLDELKYSGEPRRRHSLITASRLAAEKHVDWLITAAAMAREKVPDLTLDIYGKGVCEKVLAEQIKKLGAEEYIRLMGQQDLADVYARYEAYVSASTSEGFGLSLMEAVGSGLPVIGFDARYGGRTFIEDGANGHLLPYEPEADRKELPAAIAAAIEKLFTEDDTEAFSRRSYEIAGRFLTRVTEKKWKDLIAK